MRDENRARLVAEDGGRLLAPLHNFTLIRDAAAARGLRFGTAFKLDHVQNDEDYANLIREQASMVSPDADNAPASIQPEQGEFDWTRPDGAAKWASDNGLPMRLHMLNYPAHDFPWANAETVTADTWRGLIDDHFEAIAARPWASDVVSIDVSNELADPTQSDGFRRHVWFDAGGEEWLIHCFEKARALWPKTPLYLCQDLQEQVMPGYDIFGAFLKVVDVLLSAGAPITGVNLQGHLTLSRGWDGVAFRNHLKALRSRGLRIIAGEIDVRTGNTGDFVPANYSNASYDRAAASLLSRYLSVVLPFVDGGELHVWGLADAYNPWGASERPNLFDSDLALKPQLYDAVLEQLARR